MTKNSLKGWHGLSNGGGLPAKLSRKASVVTCITAGPESWLPLVVGTQTRALLYLLLVTVLLLQQCNLVGVSGVPQQAVGADGSRSQD